MAREKAANRQSIGSDGYDTDQYVQAVQEGNYASDSSEDDDSSSGFAAINI